MTIIHISVPRYIIVKQPVHECPTCKTCRRFLLRVQPWYGADSTCLTCGDSWQDGERMERPFMRGWRKESVKHARAFWARFNTPEGRAEVQTNRVADIKEMKRGETKC